jgi:hypothetical protein
MGNCIVSTSYTMKADIYSASVTQDPNTGIVDKSWEYQKTIDCFAMSTLRRGVGLNSTTVDINEYIDIITSLVKLRSSEPINYNLRVVGIRNSNGLVYSEDQFASSQGGVDGATIFEPRGSVPLVNFDGSIIEYETILKRQEVQRLS